MNKKKMACEQPNISMGTKLEFVVDILANSAGRVSTWDGIRKSRSWEICKQKLLHHSMDRFFNSNDKELIRTTMLRQDKIFQKQVQEFHRLYGVQKVLMDELRINRPELHQMNNPSLQAPVAMGNGTGSHGTRIALETNTSPLFGNRNQSNQNYSGHNRELPYCLRTDLRSQERTDINYSRHNSLMPGGFDLRRPMEDQVGLISVRSSKDKRSIESSNGQRPFTNGQTDVELKLGNGFASTSSNKKTRSNGLNLPLESRRSQEMGSSVSDRGGGEGSSASGNGSTTLKGGNIQIPHWLLPVLNSKKI